MLFLLLTSLVLFFTFEPIAKLLFLVKPRFWRQFSPRLLAYPTGYVLVGAARPAMLTLKIVTKIIDFPRNRSFAIGSFN